MGKDSFSILNFNIRSLSANFDGFLEMLNEMHFSFSVIGLSEIKFQSDREQIINCQLPGYTFVSQPSNSNCGGVGFFIKDNLRYFQRDDLSIITDDYETLCLRASPIPHIYQ